MFLPSFSVWVDGYHGEVAQGMVGRAPRLPQNVVVTFPQSQRGLWGLSVVSPPSESRASLVHFLGLTEPSCIVGPLEFHLVGPRKCHMR